MVAFLGSSGNTNKAIEVLYREHSLCSLVLPLSQELNGRISLIW